jgi:hypothetical protein
MELAGADFQLNYNKATGGWTLLVNAEGPKALKAHDSVT